MVTTGGKVCISIGLIVMFAGFFSMNPIIIMFMFFAGIVTIIQGARMKPLPVAAVKQPTNSQPEPRTYTFTPRKDTKGALSSVKNKGAV